MKLILATNNQNKVREIRTMLQELPYEVCSQKEAGYVLDVEETGTTFAENAALKAKALWNAAKAAGECCLTLADDSGLCVDALHGAPGVYSSRYAGENATDADRNAKLLRELENVPAAERTAKFVCDMVLILPDGTEILCEGTVSGSIGFAPQGDNGFGYDPLFYVGNRSFAEFSAEEKNAVSHRKRALEQVLAVLMEKKGLALC